MRIRGGEPGAAHSALPPGHDKAIRFVWDENGEAEVEDAVGRYVLQHGRQAGFERVKETAAKPPTQRRAKAAPEPEEFVHEAQGAEEDLRPLGTYHVLPEAVGDEGGGEEGDQAESGAETVPGARPRASRAGTGRRPRRVT